MKMDVSEALIDAIAEFVELPDNQLNLNLGHFLATYALARADGDFTKAMDIVNTAHAIGSSFIHELRKATAEERAA